MGRDGRTLRWVVLAAVLFFVLGVFFARFLAPSCTGPVVATAAPSSSDHTATTTSSSARVEKPPTILFDPDSINLLPDASLRLEVPPEPDAGLEH